MRLLLSLVFALSAGVLFAGEQVTLRKLLTADEARAWQGVGRINMRGAGFCTGAMIAPDLVLTAAHCMYNPQTGALLEPTDIEFLAGWRGGRAGAQRKARRFVVHKNYAPGRDVKIDKVFNDIAVIQLELPITGNFIKAFAYDLKPRIGDDVKVVSYAQDRAEAPSIEEQCQVIDTDPRALILTCNVDYGASGSPIFILDQGVPKIASVVSAKAIVDGRKVALGASLGIPLEELLTQIRANRGVFQSKKPGRISIAEQLGNKENKAKMLRP